MTKLLDTSDTYSTGIYFSTGRMLQGSLNPRIVFTYDADDMVSMAIEDNGDDERNDLRDSIESLNSPGASISLEEFRRQFGLR